jgi:hypothetical protein
MSRKIDHIKIGRMDILIEYQRTESNYGPGLPKHVALAESTNVLKEDWRTGSLKPAYELNSKNRIKKHYYLLWSSNEDYHLGGFTHLITKAGRPVSYRSAMKTYKDAVMATEFLEFKKVSK